MDSENGGLSSSERQRQTAAEIARKKVLAAYSSTLETLRNKSNRSNVSHQNQNQTQSQPTAQQTTNSPVYNRTPYAEYTIPENEVTAPVETPETYGYDASATPTNDYASPAETEPTPADYQPESNPESNQGTLKDVPVNQDAVNAEWAAYHSAWQDYYKNYYNDYYSKAAQTYIATEKMKNERIATGQARRSRRSRHLVPVVMIILIILTGLFLQYNRLIFAPIMAYISPDNGSAATSIEAVNPNINQSVSPEPRLLIPKLNIDVPVAFNIPTSDINAAMNQGVAQFSIPGANALPGQIGNLVISGHSAGDIYSSNPYKFIFSGLERLEVGDTIYINYESVRYTYQMTGREVVEPNDVDALIYETNKPMLTLITCTPLGTSRYRLLISAEQISPSYTNEPVEPTEPAESVEPTPTDNAMPANEPSFFENLWNWLFGNH